MTTIKMLELMGTTQCVGMLIGRKEGVLFRQRFQISSFWKDSSLINLSFEGITAMDFTFATHAFATITREYNFHEYHDKQFYLSCVNTTIVENLEVALDAMARLHSFRNCVLLVRETNKEIWLAGKYEKTLAETFSFLDSAKQLTAPEFARVANLSLNNASGRLKTLYDLGLCTRYQQLNSREFVYQELRIE